MAQERPLYIFDLDGTLALNDHRKHFIEGEEKDWDAFNAACLDDESHEAVIAVFKALRAQGAEIWIWSGRSDAVHTDTVAWLGARYLDYSRLVMRPDGNHEPDEKLKGRWLEEMSFEARQRLVATFDDRDRMVAMWRDAGITCFQVAPGNF